MSTEDSVALPLMRVSRAEAEAGSPMSLALDVRVLVKTVWVVLAMKGAS